MSRIPTLALMLLWTLAPALAVPGEVANVMATSQGGEECLIWDIQPGTLHHVYRGELGQLAAGNYGSCLVGSLPGGDAPIPEDPAPGQTFTYLVTSEDSTGEGNAGTATGGGARTLVGKCVPARRNLAAERDGDPGDGVIDGDRPLRAPSVLTVESNRETAGVFLHSGEFFLTADDHDIAGRHLDLVFRRTYRSQVNYGGPLGHNWDFAYNARLEPLGTDVIHHDGAGRQEQFQRISSSTFASPRGRYDVLVENPDGSFTLRDPHGLLRNFHAFDGSNVQGALESIEHRKGDVVTLQYDPRGLLQTITDAYGRVVDLDYDPDGRIVSVTDFAGREWAYGYDANGDLVSVRSPIVVGTPHGNDFPAGKTTSYAYSSGFADERLNHCLLQVVAPNEHSGGTPWLQNAYFGASASALEIGKLDTLTAGGTNASGVPSGGTFDLSYEFPNPGAPFDLTTPRRRTTVVDPNGNERRYTHNAHGELVEWIVRTNREVRPGEPDYTTTYAHNADGEVVEIVHPEGNRTQYAYDAPGADRYREGNRIEERHVADSLAGGGRGDGRGGESADRVWTREYEPVFNQLVREVGPRGNDPSYVPQNGGASSPGRYATDWTYCHQEGDPATNGVADEALRFGIDLTGLVSGLGDVNGDGVTDRAYGTVIRVERPAATLDAASNQAAIEGDTSQESITSHIYNPFAQRVQTTDAEGNVHLWTYHAEADPDGDGTPTPAPPDGRTLDPTDGGYLVESRADTAAGAGRNNGTDPTPADVLTTFEYDAVGNVTDVIDGRGVRTTLVRNALDQVVERRRGAATADDSGPDGDPPTGRGVTGLEAPGFRVRYVHDANDNVVEVLHEDRGDDHGVGGERSVFYTHDIRDRLVEESVEVAVGNFLTTGYRYDANLNPTEVIRPEGNVHGIRYDERDLVFETETGASGPRGGTPSVRRFDYDGNGNRVLSIDGRGNPTDDLYDGHDRLVRRVDTVGNTTDLFHDPADDVVRVLRRGPVGGPTPTNRGGATNVDLADTAYLHDERGRTFRVDSALFVPVGALPGRPPVIVEGPLLTGDGAINRILEYDRLDRPTFHVHDSGATDRLDYDGLGRVVRRILPDGTSYEDTWRAGNFVVETAQFDLSSVAGVPTELRLTTFFHDALGREVERVDHLGHTSRRVHSSLDAVVATSDGNGPAGPTIARRSTAGAGMTVATNLHGNVTTRTIDGAGRTTRTDRILTASGTGDGTPSPAPTTGDPHNPDGLLSRQFVWDDNSLLESVQDNAGNATTFTYDNLDRRVLTTNDDGTQRAVVYDPEHNAEETTDEMGTVATHVFDPANRVTLSTVARAAGVVGTTLRLYEYDGLGRLTRAFDDNEPTATADDADVLRIYDSLGRLVEEKQRLGGLPTAEKLVDVRWAADRRLTGWVYPSGRVIAHTYDAADRLVTVSDATGPESASFDWFGMHRLQTREYANGVRLTMLDDSGTVDEGYDGLHRLQRGRHVRGTGTMLAGFEHAFDRTDNRLHELRLHHPEPAAGGTRGELWQFDSANRLVDVVEAALDSALTPVGPTVDAQAWALDGDGNWARMTRNGTEYGFTPNNLHAYDEPQSGGTTTDDGVPDDAFDEVATPVADGENRAHDANGNRTADARHEYAYDFDDRLVRVVEAGTGTPIAEYRYDALGRRVSRTVTNRGALNETRRYLYAPADARGPGPVIEERDGSDALVREVVHAGDRPLWQILSGSTTHYLHEDARGNVVMLTDDAGNVLERVAYDAFGKPLFQDASNADKTDPAGGTFLAESEFGNDLLFGARVYDPETGVRGLTLNTDFGGLYVGPGGVYDPDEGRFIHRAGPADNRYGLPGPAPVNAGAMPQTREHILLGRQVGPLSGAMATGRRTYEPIVIRKRVDKATADGHEMSHSLGFPNTSEGKEVFVRDKLHVGPVFPGPRGAFSFAIEREMKESGEKAGTEDINIGIGELQEASLHGHELGHALGFTGPPEHETKESGEKGGTQDINIGVGELQECAIAIPNLLDARKGSATDEPPVAHPDFMWMPRFNDCVFPLCGGWLQYPEGGTRARGDMVLKGKKILQN